MFEGYCDDEAVERYSEKMFAYVENVFTEE